MLICDPALAAVDTVHISCYKAHEMTPYGRRQTPFTQRMAEDMQIRNLSPRTIDSYTYHVDRYAKHFGKDPAELGPEEVRDFQLWMIKEKKSWSQFNQAVCGLRFFYSITCKRDWVVKHIPPTSRSRISIRPGCN